MEIIKADTMHTPVSSFFLLFLLYDAPIRRELKQIPSWQKIRQKIAESFADKK